jgi:hypothetical protein
MIKKSWMIERIMAHNTYDRGDDKVEEPKESMTFGSLGNVCSYYKKYAKQDGFAVIKRGIKKRG